MPQSTDYTIPVTLKRGANSILVKVCEEEQAIGDSICGSPTLTESRLTI